jgi:hypothetical protein
MVLLLKILGGILVLAYGLWLGMAGEYRQRPEDIDKAMERGGSRRYRVRRRFTPLDLLRSKRRGSERRAGRGSRRPFQLASSRPAAQKDPPAPANSSEETRAEE